MSGHFKRFRGEFLNVMNLRRNFAPDQKSFIPDQHTKLNVCVFLAQWQENSGRQKGIIVSTFSVGNQHLVVNCRHISVKFWRWELKFEVITYLPTHQQFRNYINFPEPPLNFKRATLHPSGTSSICSILIAKPTKLVDTIKIHLGCLCSPREGHELEAN